MAQLSKGLAWLSRVRLRMITADTHGAAIWQQPSKKLATPGHSWRDWLMT